MSEIAERELAKAIGGYGFAYLMTVTGDGEPHAAPTRPRMEEDALRIDVVGSHSRANIMQRPQVSLVWPPMSSDGYSLIVNGTAQADSASGVTVVPARAVLHRAHDHQEAHHAGGGCEGDCVPIDLGSPDSRP